MVSHVATRVMVMRANETRRLIKEVDEKAESEKETEVSEGEKRKKLVREMACWSEAQDTAKMPLAEKASRRRRKSRGGRERWLEV